MSAINVALLQMSACGNDQEANLHKGEEFCRRAKDMGADIALFPEMWNIGYSFPDKSQTGAHERWAAQAVGPEDRFVQRFRALAAELDMAIALTYLERWPGRPRNTMTLIDRHGALALTYAKVHTCEWDAEAALTPGDSFHVGMLETAKGEVKIGAMICYDREQPESARILMLEGAEIILTPNACELESNRIGQFKARAYENMLGMAMANYAAPQKNGHSVAFHGMAFGENGKSRDTLVIEAGEAEGVYLAPFDLTSLREYRRHEVWGNAFRRPGCYGLLSSPEVSETFVRQHATR